METSLPEMEYRLQERYVNLVQAHQHAATRVAAGPSHKPAEAEGASQRQAAWRFFKNARVTLPVLAEPLREVARKALADSPAPCALAIHDWCTLAYGDHDSKTDRAPLTHEHDIGYDLATVLIVDAANGDTLAPADLNLRTADAIHSTRPEAIAYHCDHLSQVLPAMEESKTWGLPKPLVHVIDREADSVGHYRQWHEAGHSFLIRGDERLVMWRGEEYLLSEVVAKMDAEGAFNKSRDVLYQGQEAWQEVAEVEVVLHRPAKQRRDGKQRDVAGPALPLRLVVARVRDQEGTLLAEWLLLSNVSLLWADASLLALWYYWRWRIETYHKLLKSLGQEIEHWQQENGLAIAKRLLVAAMACATVWLLARLTTPEAEELKGILVGLSGRQMKTGCAFAVPALLAGLHVFLAFFAALARTTLARLRFLALLLIPFFTSG
jgi:hypothetical protein